MKTDLKKMKLTYCMCLYVTNNAPNLLFNKVYVSQNILIMTDPKKAEFLSVFFYDFKAIKVKISDLLLINI